jgi:hypothetical protein
MAKTKKRTTKSKAVAVEPDGAFFLKLVLYLIVGSQWLDFERAGTNTVIPVPVGLLVGLLFAMHDHFQIDRKIEYALLLIAMFVGFWAQIGLIVNY